MTDLDPPRHGDGKYAPYASAETDLQLDLQLGLDVEDPVLTDHVPLVEHERAFHVGTFEVADRESWSYEGDGLSVSVDPDDWARIAKLPGRTWQLERTDGEPLRFVSWHDLDEPARDRVRAWGVEHGWIEQQETHRLHYVDEDTGESTWTDFDTAADADEEAEVMQLDDHEVVSLQVWRATDTFPQRLAFNGRGFDPTDVLLGSYVKEHRPDLDGVWWEDEYDPEALSCPRGVLVHDLDHYGRRPV